MKRSALNKRGKHWRLWQKARREWINANPEPWICVACGKRLTYETLTLDHNLSRSRRPDLRYEQSNLAPMCYLDNMAKGSLSLEQYLEKLKSPEGGIPG